MDISTLQDGDIVLVTTRPEYRRDSIDGLFHGGCFISNLRRSPHKFYRADKSPINNREYVFCADSNGTLHAYRDDLYIFERS